MKKSSLFASGIGLGVAVFYGWRWYQGFRRIRDFHLTTADLDYSDRSPEELASKHLIDLNVASVDQIGALGVSAESAERLMENRPYRNKLELVSRMVLTQDEYSKVKDRVAISAAREPVKTLA